MGEMVERHEEYMAETVRRYEGEATNARAVAEEEVASLKVMHSTAMQSIVEASHLQVLELKQQLWKAGAQQADLDAAAGNCIIPPMGQTPLLPFLSRAFLSIELLGMPSFSNSVPLAQAASTTCRSVIVLPMKLSLQGEHQFLVSQSHGLVIGHTLEADGRAHKLTHTTANSMATAVLGQTCDTFLTHSTPDGNLLIFTISVPDGSTLPLPTGSAWAPHSIFSDTLSLWATCASNAILAVAPPPPPQSNSSLVSDANHKDALVWR